MFLSSLIEELCTKEENNEVGCTLTFGGQCITPLHPLVKLQVKNFLFNSNFASIY